MTEARRRSVLVAGASIAGPALAYWLHRYGFEVTVVEKAPGIRAGGYPIDIRGTATEVVRRMDLLPQLHKARVDTQRLTFLDASGDTIATLRPEAISIGAGEDMEVSRGDLTAILYETVRDDVAFVFGDFVTGLDDGADGVDVTFCSGARRTFDIVVAADGIHSATRRLRFGPEERFHHYLGSCFAGFTAPNRLGLCREAILWSAPGRSAALYSVDDGDLVHGFFFFARPEAPFAAVRDVGVQRELVAATFPDRGWEIPRMVGDLRAADDLYFDFATQIRMTSWSRGRVVLVGDAAYAPSHLTGQGTSLALTGAYVLANELATHADHTEAFAAYDATMRPFATLNQGLADDGDTELFPRTAEALRQRNDVLRTLSALPPDEPNAAYSALTLPDHKHT